MTAALKLYEATDALATVREWIEEHADEILAAGGELPPELAELVDLAESQFEAKVERVGLFIREQEATADGIEGEAKRLLARASTHRNVVTGLKAYLKRQMEAAGRDKVERPLITAALQRNSQPSVRLADGCTLDQPETREALGDLCVPHVSYQLDRAAIVQRHKAGTPLPDILSVETGRHLRLR